jgi:hypothetical protein
MKSPWFQSTNTSEELDSFRDPLKKYYIHMKESPLTIEMLLDQIIDLNIIQIAAIQWFYLLCSGFLLIQKRLLQ